MKQMITRLDDDLHSRLKARAAVEDRSVNELVIAILTGALDGAATRQAIRDRAWATGRLVVPEPPTRTPRPDEVELAARGFGDAVSGALERERSAR